MLPFSLINNSEKNYCHKISCIAELIVGVGGGGGTAEHAACWTNCITVGLYMRETSLPIQRSHHGNTYLIWPKTGMEMNGWLLL